MIRLYDQKIEIKIDDIEKFRMVAFLVDRGDFLKDVHSIRRNLLRLHQLISYDKVFAFLKELKKNSKKNGKKTEMLNCEMQKDGINYLFTDSELVESVHWMERKYKKNTRFDMVFTYAIIAGNVTDKEIFSTAHLQYLDDSVLKSFKLDGHYQVAIVVSRDTRIDEVENVFKKEVQPFFEMIGFSKPDTFPEIKRNREWYWLKKQLSWKGLFSHVKRSYKGKIADNSIRSAVMAYEKQLKDPLYSSTPVGLTTS